VKGTVLGCCSVLKRWGLKKVSVALENIAVHGCHPNDVLDEYFLRNFSKFHCFLFISSYFFGFRRMDTVGRHCQNVGPRVVLRQTFYVFVEEFL
jgi:hypothetical protein